VVASWRLDFATLLRAGPAAEGVPFSPFEGAGGGGVYLGRFPGPAGPLPTAIPEGGGSGLAEMGSPRLRPIVFSCVFWCVCLFFYRLNIGQKKLLDFFFVEVRFFCAKILEV
jgi:hypothetical protein